MLPRLHDAPPYWHCGCEVQGRLGLHEVRVAAQLPVVIKGQSLSAKQDAYWQFVPYWLQVFCVHCPAGGRQSALLAHDIPSAKQLWVRHWASDEQNFPDW